MFDGNADERGIDGKALGTPMVDVAVDKCVQPMGLERPDDDLNLH